ncbi:MAG: hypothetical protein ABI415_01560 [Flavitalea sp.]
MPAKRKITEDEMRLLDFLIKKAKLKLPANWKENLMVKSMDDAGMGSLVLYPKEIAKDEREFGSAASEIEFKDEDRKDVIASLNLDEAGEIFELDIWKTTFDPLIRIPKTFSDAD